jgi:integrase
MPRRSDHEGSIRRKPTGRWEGSISLAGHRHWVSGRTRGEVLEKLRALQAQAQTGSLPQPSRLTVGELLERWLEATAPDLKPSTLARYRQLATHYLAPTLGSLRLQKVRPVHVVQAIAVWRRQGSPGTVNAAFRALHRAFAVAVQWGLLAANPCDRVATPRPQYREAKVWTVAEARAFLVASARDRWHPLWAFLLGTGCRLGEALGLGWDEVDLEHGTATIARSLVWVGGTSHVQDPKTRASRRTLTLPPFVVEALRWWKVRQGEERLQAGPAWKDGRGAVFTTSTGAPPSVTNLRRSFRRGCRQAGVPPCRIHDLRHFAATLLVASGVDPKAVQARLGHATLAMTLGLYSKALPAGDQQAAQVLGQALEVAHG